MKYNVNFYNTFYNNIDSGMYNTTTILLKCKLV